MRACVNACPMHVCVYVCTECITVVNCCTYVTSHFTYAKPIMPKKHLQLDIYSHLSSRSFRLFLCEHILNSCPSMSYFLSVHCSDCTLSTLSLLVTVCLAVSAGVLYTLEYFVVAFSHCLCCGFQPPSSNKILIIFRWESSYVRQCQPLSCLCHMYMQAYEYDN